MKRLMSLPPVLFVVLVVLVTACTAQRPEPASFTINMTEYAFNPNTIEVQVGQEVTLELVNEGALEHEIMFGRNVMMMNNRPAGYQEDMFAVGGVEPQVEMVAAEMSEHEEEEEHAGFMVLLPATGDKASLKFVVTEAMVGEWEMGCFEQDGVHYDAGMKGTFIVNP